MSELTDKIAEVRRSLLAARLKTAEAEYVESMAKCDARIRHWRPPAARGEHGGAADEREDALRVRVDGDMTYAKAYTEMRNARAAQMVCETELDILLDQRREREYALRRRALDMGVEQLAR
jgi:hypothetical protein